MPANTNSDMSFLDHLEELRWHLIRSFMAVLVLAVLAFVFKGLVFDTVLLGPSRPDFLTNRLLCRVADWAQMPVLCINQVQLSFQSIQQAGQFSMHICGAFIAGAPLAFPYIFYGFWRFIRPALYENGVRHSRGAILAASLLFSVGILFAYFVIAPLSVYFLCCYQITTRV